VWSWLLRRQPAKVEPDRSAIERVAAMFPVLSALDASDRSLLHERVAELLSVKSFQGAGGYEPTGDDVLAVAVLAAWPLIRLDLSWYRGFHTFILYPGEYLADVEDIDEAGVVHSGRDLRSGEAWVNGPVVLGMDEVYASGQGDGFNVVVHELAHQIDQLNGETDGFPPLHREMPTQRWTEAFSAAFARLEAEVEQGREPSLDPYGLESPGEFFAVCCEHFFDTPDWLSEQYPALFDQLGQFFRNRPSRQPV
jgi:Mlc titration factor MtfA (ptsG expression regulator)